MVFLSRLTLTLTEAEKIMITGFKREHSTTSKKRDFKIKLRVITNLQSFHLVHDVLKKTGVVSYKKGWWIDLKARTEKDRFNVN